MKPDKVFQSGMLLQREKPIPIWGTARPGAEVTVSVQGKAWTGVADSTGTWFVSVGPLYASKSEELTVTEGKEQVLLSDVAVGDIFLAGGQSNMEFLMRYEQFFQEELSVCQNDVIRFYDVPECAYEGQERDFDYSNVGIWRKAGPESLDFFSAPGYYFAKRLHQALGIPVGIIGLNWGGTRSSAWMREDHAREICPEQAADFMSKLKGQTYESFLKTAGSNPMNDRGYSVWDPFSEFIMPRTPGPEEIGAFFAEMSSGGLDLERYMELPDPKHYPGALYTHMVQKIAPFGVKGALWYQGESDDDLEESPAHYAASLSALMSDWREAWGEALPFFIVQLPGFRSWLACQNRAFSLIRRAQQQVCDEDRQAYLCSISDLGEEWDIHPKNKRDVGLRLALLALEHLYGAEMEADPPVCREARRQGDRIILRFDHAGSGLSIRGDTVSALSVTGAGKPVPYTCTAEGGRLAVQLPENYDGPVEVSLAWTAWYRVNLYNSAGIPAIPFRFSC